MMNLRRFRRLVIAALTDIQLEQQQQHVWLFHWLGNQSERAIF